jgi:hypothetical protein
MSCDKPTGKLEKAAFYYLWKVELGYRAGYVINITTHASRREVIVKVAGKSLGLRIMSALLTPFLEDSYEETESMKFSKHSNRNVCRKAYSSSLLVDS